MPEATVELDFLGVHTPTVERSVSRVNPQLLPYLIMNPVQADVPTASGLRDKPANANRTCFGLPFPVLNPACRHDSWCPVGTAPMTFFYNGAVTVFNVARDTAERIIKMADEQYVEHRLLRNLHDVPLARKKSLQRFLEKRRERLTATTPYKKSVK